MASNNSGVIGVSLTDTPSDNTLGSGGHALGTRVTVSDGGEAIFVQANGAITAYDAVGIDEDYQAAALTKAMADDGWMIGFAQVAFADNDFGWVHIKGSNIRGRGAAACQPDVALYTSATAGVLDDTSASQTKINGVVFVATASGTNAEVIATFPRSTTF